jgi:sucrose phosphorylase
VFDRYRALLKARAAQPAFHPTGDQQVVAGNPALFILLRTGPDGQARVLCLHNISDRPQQFAITPTGPDLSGAWRNILPDSNEEVPIDRESGLSLLPYEVKWLAAL